MRKPSPASNRLKVFRDWARDITERVNELRKYGRPVDANGEIARAMERAYKQGFEDGQSGSDSISLQNSCDPDDPNPVPEALVSRKISGVLFRIGHRQVGVRDRLQTDDRVRAYYIQETHISTPGRKAPDWQIAPGFSETYEKGVSDRSIQQLAKLGILRSAHSTDPKMAGRKFMTLSAKGKATYLSMFVRR